MEENNQNNVTPITMENPSMTNSEQMNNMGAPVMDGMAEEPVPQEPKRDIFGNIIPEGDTPQMNAVGEQKNMFENIVSENNTTQENTQSVQRDIFGNVINSTETVEPQVDLSNKKFKLTLHRQKNFVGCLIGFIIYIDGEKVGKLKNGKTLELEVAGGNHTISIHKNNQVDIFIDKDTTADVVVYGANNFGITNINGEGSTSEENTDHYLQKNQRSTNSLLGLSIALPIISVIIWFAFKFYIQFWVFGIVAGYGIVNLAGLKNLKGKPEYKPLLIKNIIAMVISIVCAIVMAFVVSFAI